METSQPNRHSTAIVNPAAILPDSASIGPFSIIESNVNVGDNCRIDSHVLIGWGTTLGAECQAHKGAVIGTIPQDLKFDGEESELIIGDRTIIREYCTLNRGTLPGEALTKVGSDCLLMAYSHIAHDCILGDHVIIANSVQMAGHIEIDSYSSVGGLCAIHQFVKIGESAFVGGRSRVPQDVPPYILASGEPLKFYGLNAVGLRRRGFSRQQISDIKKAYGFIYSENLNLTQAVDAIKSELELTPELNVILEFIERSNRGFISG